eukprot:bmy_03223T0
MPSKLQYDNLVDAGWIGFWSIVGGCVVGIAMAREQHLQMGPKERVYSNKGKLIVIEIRKELKGIIHKSISRTFHEKSRKHGKCYIRDGISFSTIGTILKDRVCRFYQGYAETNSSPPVFWGYTIIHVVHPDLFEQHHTPAFNHRCFSFNPVNSLVTALASNAFFIHRHPFVLYFHVSSNQRNSKVVLVQLVPSRVVFAQSPPYSVLQGIL